MRNASLIVALAMAGVLAGCDSKPTPPTSASASATGSAAGAADAGSLSPKAKALDAYMQSDAAHRDMLSMACADASACADLPNFFRMIKQADPAAYDAFLRKASAGAMDDPAASSRAGFEFAMQMMNNANRDLDDDSLQLVLRDTAQSFRDIKAVYPPLCGAMLGGRSEPPPADTMKAMFRPDRYRLNFSMVQKAAANRQLAAHGELKLPAAPAEAVNAFSKGFFDGLPADQHAAVQRVLSGAAQGADNAVACDVQEQLMLALANKPKEEAGAIMRGLSQ